MASVPSYENALYKTNYHTILYNSIQYSKIQCNTIHYPTMQYNTIQSIRIKYKTGHDKIRYNEIRKEKIRKNYRLRRDNVQNLGLRSRVETFDYVLKRCYMYLRQKCVADYCRYDSD